MSLLCYYRPQNATLGDVRRRPAAVASAPRLPALRPEDVLIQRDERGQKVLLGKGAFGEVRPPRLNGSCSLCDLFFQRALR